MSIKLIASDMDGTLLLNGATEVSEEIFTLIKKLKAKGILFVVASGRQYKNLRQLFAPVKDDIAYICDNGGVCIYQDKIIQEKTLAHDLALLIAEDILSQEGCEVQIVTPEVQYLKPKVPAFAEKMKQESGLNVKIITEFNEVGAPILKVSMYCEDGIKKAEYWQKKYGDLCTLQCGRCDWIDFLPKTTSKGQALKVLLKHLGIKKAESVAFGDYYNDIEMLQAVGVPIVMDWAPEDIKKMACQTAKTVEDELRKICRD